MPGGSGAANEPGSRSGDYRAVLELVLVGAIALAVRLVDLGHPPFIDEFHHLLAAASLLENGSLAIHDGVEYTRGWPLTYLVAGFFSVFGQSLEVARWPAVISGVLLVCLLFAWLRAEAGRTAAWIGAMLLCFSPIALYLSQWVRFYTLHALLFWLGCYGVYRLHARPSSPRRRLLVGVATLAAFLAAFDLQITTVVGVGGVILFAALVQTPRLVVAARSKERRWIVIVFALLALAAAVGIVASGVADWLIDRARYVDSWALDRADNIRFYHWLLTEEYGFLWVLFPMAVLVALTGRSRQLALLFVSVFGVAFVGHSLSAWKSERFLFYAMPAFFAVWAIAAAEVAPWLWQRLVAGARSALAHVPAVSSRPVIGLAVLAAVAFALSGLPAYTTTRLIYFEREDWSPPPDHKGERYRGHPDWKRAAPVLDAIDDSVAVLVGQPDMKLIYYLGDVDYLLEAGYLVSVGSGDAEPQVHPEFSIWPKVGRPLVSTPESIALIVSCYTTGLLVAEEHVWGWRWGVPRATVAFIEQNLRAVEMPDDTGILAFRWESDGEDSARCESIRRRGPASSARPVS